MQSAVHVVRGEVSWAPLCESRDRHVDSRHVPLRNRSASSAKIPTQARSRRCDRLLSGDWHLGLFVVITTSLDAADESTRSACATVEPRSSASRGIFRRSALSRHPLVRVLPRRGVLLTAHGPWRVYDGLYMGGDRRLRGSTVSFHDSPTRGVVVLTWNLVHRVGRRRAPPSVPSMHSCQRSRGFMFACGTGCGCCPRRRGRRTLSAMQISGYMQEGVQRGVRT